MLFVNIIYVLPSGSTVIMLENALCYGDKVFLEFYLIQMKQETKGERKQQKQVTARERARETENGERVGERKTGKKHDRVIETVRGERES